MDTMLNLQKLCLIPLLSVSLTFPLRGDEAVVTSFAESTAAPHGRGNLYAPDIVRLQEKWLMFFGGQGKDGHDRIHLATFTDGKTWKQQGVVFAPEGVNHVNDPSVVVVNNRLWMYYTLAGSGVTDSIGLAISDDGQQWEDAGIVLAPTEKTLTGEPEWDSLLVGRPSVMLEGKRFRMWYDGRKDLPLGAPDPTAPKSSHSRRYVGYAESEDGKTWMKRPEPVFGEDAGGVHVTRIGDQYVMVIESRDGTKWASSSDGLRWESRGLLYSKDSNPQAPYGHVTPFLLASGGSLRLYYGAAAAETWNQNAIYSAEIKADDLKQIP